MKTESHEPIKYHIEDRIATLVPKAWRQLTYSSLEMNSGVANLILVSFLVLSASLVSFWLLTTLASSTQAPVDVT